MKPLILSTGLLLLLLTGACQSPEQSANEEANPLEGTWEFVRGRYVLPDTTVEVSERRPPSIKVVNATHYAIGRQAGEDSISGNGGRYQYDGNTITQTIEYHYIGEFVGETHQFDTQLEGDSIWHKSGTIRDTIELEETWRRIE